MAKGRRGRKSSEAGKKSSEGDITERDPQKTGLPTSGVDSVVRGVASARAQEPLAPQPLQWLHPGSEIGGRFVVEAFAAQGGMGVVYRAKDSRSGKTVALKVMSKRDYEAERFGHEGRALAELPNKAIVKYVDHGIEADGMLYLAMEWLEGETLAERLKRGPLSGGETLEVAIGAATGLAAAHRRGFVHRDVKPSNFFLVEGAPNKIKLLDFGIVRRYLEPSGLTQAGSVLGTVGYMAPEQAIGGDVDPRADVFSLGCVLYACVTGRAPYEGVNPLAVLMKLVMEESPSLYAVSAIPQWFRNLVNRMLSKGRSARPANASSVLSALRLGGGELFGAEKGAHSRLGDAARETGDVDIELAMDADTQEGNWTALVVRPFSHDVESVKQLLAPLGGPVVGLLDGTYVVRLDGWTPRVRAHLASGAREIRAALPAARVAVVSSQADGQSAAERHIARPHYLSIDEGARLLMEAMPLLE